MCCNSKAYSVNATDAFRHRSLRHRDQRSARTRHETWSLGEDTAEFGTPCQLALGEQQEVCLTQCDRSAAVTVL